MRISKRVEKLPPYLFVEISRKIAEKRAKGERVISFAIGDPDLPTPSSVVDQLCRAAQDPANHRYPETEGLPELRQAVSAWYEERFGVILDSDKEVLPLIGSKEGIGHVALCFIDPGDIALVPDPAYPVYAIGTMFAGGETYSLPLREEQGFLPDLDQIPEKVAQQAKVLWINYPNNPTAAVAGLDFYERVVAFAKKHEIAVCSDNPYTEVSFDGYRPNSFLEAPGARDIGMEFHSLSKSFNMTGWRIAMTVGNADMVNALMPAIEALQTGRNCIQEHNIIYQRRRDQMIEVLNEMGLHAVPPKASLYIWTKLPSGTTSIPFATRLLEEAGVVVTPGVGYGEAGEGYIRLSLTTSDADLEEGLARLKAWHHQNS
jgi:LL-diaminopimelate aminotransferase